MDGGAQVPCIVRTGLGGNRTGARTAGGEVRCLVCDTSHRCAPHAHSGAASDIEDDVAGRRAGTSDRGQPVSAADVAADVGQELGDLFFVFSMSHETAA